MEKFPSNFPCKSEEARRRMLWSFTEEWSVVAASGPFHRSYMMALQHFFFSGIARDKIWNSELPAIQI